MGLITEIPPPGPDGMPQPLRPSPFVGKYSGRTEAEEEAFQLRRRARRRELLRRPWRWRRPTSE